MGTWMTRGGESRYVPDWNIDTMRRSGWHDVHTPIGRITQLPTDAGGPEIREPQTDALAPGWRYDGAVVGEGDFFERYVQRAAEKLGNDPVTQRSGADVSAVLPRAGAQEWLKQNVEDANRYALTEWAADVDENGNVVYRATYRARDLPGQQVGIRRSLSRGDRFTVTFQGGEAEKDPIDKLDQDAVDTFGLTNAVGTDRATQMRDRILTSFNISNFPAGIQDMINSGELNWRPGQVADDVRSILENESLGDQSRREFLADMVLNEYETSAYAVAFEQAPTVEEPDFDPYADALRLLNEVLGGLGGGGGRTGPAYRPPDRREVEENVQNYLRTVLGDTGDPALVDELSDIYMRDHRRSFDNPSTGLQPWFSVKERVHSLEEYNKLHALRPDTIPEEQWITQFQQIVDEAGVPASLRDQTARNFAQTGTTLRHALPGAFRQQETREGRPQPTFLNNLSRQVATLARKF